MTTKIKTDGAKRDRSTRHRLWVLAVSSGMVLAACATGPASETAAKLHDRGSRLPALTATSGGDARAVARAALLSSPKVREDAGLTHASADQIAVERAALFPKLGIGLTTGTGKAGAGDPSVEMSGGQLIFDFGATKRNVTAADLNLQIQHLRLQESVDGAISEALLTYRQIAMFDSVVAIKSEQMTVMRELYELIRSSLESGASAAPDLLETQNRIERAEYEHLNAQLERDELRDKLQRIAGQAKGGMLPKLSQSCSPVGGETDLLRIAKLELAKSTLQLESAQKARLPRVSLNPLAMLPLGGGGISTGVNLDVNSDLLEGGAIQARTNVAANRLRSAQAAVDAAQREMRLDELRLQRQLGTLEKKAAMLERQIDIAGQTRDLYRSQYIELGNRQITDVLDMEETLFERRVELAETRYQLQERLVECATRAKSLRDVMGLSGSQLYGYPLTRDGF